MNDFIDKDSPDNLSDRDKPIYERWCKDKWSISYSEYLETDHWAIVKKENAIRWKVCVLSRTHTKLPMITHHRDDPRGGYPCMWKEVLDDVVLVCRNCHERHHDIWPEVNCKGSRYAGSMIMSMVRKQMNEVCEKNNVSSRRVIELFTMLLRDCQQSVDKKLRDSAVGNVGKIILVTLDKKYQHSAITKLQLVNFLIESLYSWKTGCEMPDLREHKNIISTNTSKINFIADNSNSLDALYLIAKLSSLDIYKDIDICSY